MDIEERKKSIKEKLKVLAGELNLISMKRWAYSVGKESEYTSRILHKKKDLEFRKLSREYRKLIVMA